jgi:hypothetical protein
MNYRELKQIKTTNMFTANIVADSLNPFGDRLTSFEITFPRIVLAEFNTHRAFSRNSASSRAIPFPKMLKSVIENPFVPIAWQSDHSGMQGSEYFSPTDRFFFKDVSHHILTRFKLKQTDEEFKPIRKVLERIFFRREFQGTKTLPEWWLVIRDLVVECATLLYCFRLTKQICNRLLEPFMWHTVLVTASDFENFFALRAHPGAEIHMQKIAAVMLETYNMSEPEELGAGQWHIPYRNKAIAVVPAMDSVIGYDIPGVRLSAEMKAVLKVATMMAARTSYTVPHTELSEWTVKKYCQKHDDMMDNGHWSPFEHCGLAMNQDERQEIGWSGNFFGFIQYRKLFPNENRRDDRVIKKTLNAKEA